MPKPAKKKANAPRTKKTKLNLQIREILGDAYSFVLGEKFTKSISSVNLEMLMKEQINQTEGTDGMTAIRLNKKDRVDRIVNSITEVVKTVKKLPPSAFSLKPEDGTGNANTSKSGTDEVPS